MRRLFSVVRACWCEPRGRYDSPPATGLKRAIGFLIPLLLLSTQFVRTQSPAQTGALGMGFWQNKNGQALIANGATTGGVCKLSTWLRSYAPFLDLSATADCKQVASYVSAVIKAANASGSSMNPMLKAQMLATSLDAYFSDPTLGGNSISAPAPIGGVSIDLTRVCGEGAAGCVDVSAAFGIAAPLKNASVSYVLSYASAQSNAGGGLWYGNSKTIQGLAKNTFQAINSQLAFTITPAPPSSPPALGIPVTNPSAITADVPALVTVSSFLTARGSAAPVPTSVSLEQVDSSGGIIATLGSLSDAGTNGDRSAGDQILAGQFTFNVAAPGTVWLRVSATFTGVADPVRSASKPLEVLAPGVPLQVQYFPDSQVVADTNGRQMPCDQVLALFKPGTNSADISTLASSIGGRVVGFLPGAQLHTWQIQITCTTAQDVMNAVNTLLGSPLVVAAEANYLVHATGVTPNDPGFIRCQIGSSLPDGRTCFGNSAAPELTHIGVDRAWAITQGRSAAENFDISDTGPLIAVLDTGVDYTHEDLADAGKVIKGRNFVGGSSDPMDDHGHGTSVASVAAASGNNGIGIPGVSWASPILAEKVMNGAGQGTHLNVAAGIADAVMRGAKIINLSLGDGLGSRPDAITASALDGANRAGALVVAAAGNDYCSEPQYPAGYGPQTTIGTTTFNTTVLSVGGIDISGGGIAHSSDNNCTEHEGSNFGPWVAVYAPWDAYTAQAHQCVVCSVGRDYVVVGGTSFAAPFVSGAAALVWAANPQMSAGDVMKTLVDTARGRAFGGTIGTVDVFSAVLQAAATRCSGCPEEPEASVAPSALLTGPTITVGKVRASGELQSKSVHGVSLALMPIQRAHGSLGTLPVAYDISLGYHFATWDSYTCCSSSGKGFFDSFSVSTSVVPYWQLELQGPLSLFYTAELPSSPGQPHDCESMAFPAVGALRTCPFDAAILLGGQNRGAGLQQSSTSVAGVHTTVPGAFGFGRLVTWLNFVLDTATPPDSDNLFPSYGSFVVYDITPLCFDGTGVLRACQ